MKVKLDENLPVDLIDDLRAAGHEADTVRDEALAGAPDAVILDRVRQDGRVLFTLDKGIANVRAYSPEQHAGIVLFRPRSLGRDTPTAEAPIANDRAGRAPRRLHGYALTLLEHS